MGDNMQGFVVLNFASKMIIVLVKNYLKLKGGKVHSNCDTKTSVQDIHICIDRI